MIKIFTISLLFVTFISNAATWYVAPDGLDTNQGNAANTLFSLNKAWEKVTDAGLTYSGTAPDIGAFEKVPGFTSEKPVFSNKPDIKIYPNPARSYINVAGLEMSAEPLIIRIIEVTGALRSESRLEPGVINQIQLNLKPGLYIVQVKKGSLSLAVQKLMVAE